MHGRSYSVTPPTGCSTLLYKAKVAVKGINVLNYVLGESAVPAPPSRARNLEKCCNDDGCHLSPPDVPSRALRASFLHYDLG